MMVFSIILLLLQEISTVPIVNPESVPVPVIKHCELTQQLGLGTIEFLEECQTLEKFEKVPKPYVTELFGVHPRVCCPRWSEDYICFESECPQPSETEGDFPLLDNLEDEVEASGDNVDDDKDVYTYDYEEYYDDFEIPTFADGDCAQFDGQFEVLSSCVVLTRCPGTLDTDQAPRAVVACGFDTGLNQLKICCPPENVTETQNMTQPARFPDRSGEARRVEDKTKLCARWKRYGACNLDRHFNITDDEEDPWNYPIYSKDMFDLMQKSCPDTCGWVESGCHDEHPRCEEWSRLGLCNVNTNPSFMAHTCRESCGVCGFLSPHNLETQRKDDRSYTDFRQEDFECGRFKPLSEVNQEAEVAEVEDKNINCGATVVSDRWMITAAHCYDNLGEEKVSKISGNTIRAGTKYKETIEVKRIYRHPNYFYPYLYNDIALVELGRRIPFDYDLYGDSPICLDRSNGLEENFWSGTLATVQGYGVTENGTRGRLLEVNVTVIDNEECTEQLKYNATRGLVRNKLKALPRGIIGLGLFCTQGEKDEVTGRFDASCKGDSGGPLLTSDPGNEARQTLIGVVSGGAGCGRGVPSWYTRISYHADWFNCIIDKTINYLKEGKADHKRGFTQRKVEEDCQDYIQSEPPCTDENNLLLDDQDLDKSIKLCN